MQYDSNMDSHVRVPANCISEFQSALTKSMQQLLRLLHNLFDRDLMAL